MYCADRIRSSSERKRLKPAFHYRLNKRIRYAAMKTMSTLVARSEKESLDYRKERIEKILLVRTTFRIGDSILTTPAISIFRENFPGARIDFVGGPISRILFQNLPIDHHYQITRRFPNVSWAYLLLLRQIRSVGYDLAIELSYSQSTMGSFIVGLSGARFTVGREGKWDQWFNIKLPKMANIVEVSKYKRLPVLLGSLGLETKEIFPSIILSFAEKEEGQRRIASLIGQDTCPIVGVFVGGRVSWGKRWPKEHFLALVIALHARGVKIIVFIGPEEKELIAFFTRNLPTGVPLVYDVALRTFAAMVSNCQLFVACDSGPMHLACALGVRTVAIFQNPNFKRWGPPPELGRSLYQPERVSVQQVISACLDELSLINASSHRAGEARKATHTSQTQTLQLTHDRHQ